MEDLTRKLSASTREALAAEDLVFSSRRQSLSLVPISLEPDLIYEQIARALFRSVGRHVVLTGDRGVGKTSALRELAARVHKGGLPTLTEKRFLRLDCSPVPADDGRAVLEHVISQVGEWPNLVLCLDGMAPLLKRSPDNITLLKAILTRSGLQMIGVMSTWEHQDLLAGDAQLQDMLTRIEISEPTEEETLEIVKSHRSALEQQYAVSLKPDRREFLSGVPCSTSALSMIRTMSISGQHAQARKPDHVTRLCQCIGIRPSTGLALAKPVAPEIRAGIEACGWFANYAAARRA